MSVEPRTGIEDLVPGQVFVLPGVQITREDIFAFAREFDPFPFHLDETVARRSLLGGLAASGWHTLSAMHHQLVTALSPYGTVRTKSFSCLKWQQPVMARDVISGRAEFLAARAVDDDPALGIADLSVTVRNQKDAAVMRVSVSLLIPRQHGPMGVWP